MENSHWIEIRDSSGLGCSAETIWGLFWFVNIEVRSSQPDFQIQAVHVVEGPFTASFEQSGAGRFRVKVKVIDQRIDDEGRTATGKLVIVSNDRTEPQKEFPLFGFGRVNRVERPENAP